MKIPGRTALVAFILWSDAALAVCTEWTDAGAERYRHPSIREEARAASAIVIGKVIAMREATEDPADPEHVTSFTYVLQVRNRIRGKSPSRIRLSVENDSGSYRMRPNETHVLFLQRNRGTYFADVCGNSADLGRNPEALKRIRAVLAGKVADGYTYPP